MNEPEKPIQNFSDTGDLKQQIAILNRQSNFLFICLVIVTLTFTAYVGLQARRTGKDLDVIREQASRISEANQKEDPAIRGIITRLSEYGQTHPDYQPILRKYGIKPGTNTGAANPVAPVHPATAPKK